MHFSKLNKKVYSIVAASGISFVFSATLMTLVH